MEVPLQKWVQFLDSELPFCHIRQSTYIRLLVKLRLDLPGFLQQTSLGTARDLCLGTHFFFLTKAMAHGPGRRWLLALPSGATNQATGFIPIAADTGMRLMQFSEEWRSSTFQRPSVPAQREPCLKSFLLSLLKVHLLNWVDGPF